MTRLRALVLSCAFFLALAGNVRLDAEVTVARTEPTVEQRVLDPRNPPPEKAKIAPNHPAFTNCAYSAKWYFHFDTEKLRADNGRTVVRLTMRSIDLTLSLRSTIWLPAGSSDWLLAHERGHQKIGERSYHSSDRFARQLAQEIVIGQSFDGEGGNIAAATQAACDNAGHAWLSAYIKSLRDPAQRVHELYDQITNHGTNRQINPDDAVQQAIDRYRAEHTVKRTASTRPADATPTTQQANSN